MFIEVGCILTGIPLGYLLRHHKRFVSGIDAVTMWSIYTLLFLLGVSLGANKELVAQLGTIGLRATIISIFCVVGSTAATWVLDVYILKGKLDER